MKRENFTAVDANKIAEENYIYHLNLVIDKIEYASRQGFFFLNHYFICGVRYDRIVEHLKSKGFKISKPWYNPFDMVHISWKEVSK